MIQAENYKLPSLKIFLHPKIKPPLPFNNLAHAVLRCPRHSQPPNKILPSIILLLMRRNSIGPVTRRCRLGGGKRAIFRISLVKIVDTAGKPFGKKNHFVLLFVH